MYPREMKTNFKQPKQMWLPGTGVRRERRVTTNEYEVSFLEQCKCSRVRELWWLCTSSYMLKAKELYTLKKTDIIFCELHLNKKLINYINILNTPIKRHKLLDGVKK